MSETPREPWLLSRRRCLELATVGAVSAPLSMLAAAAQAAPDAAPRRRVLRFAHLTDTHVQPELHATEGLTTCLRHVQSLDDPVDLIVTGGDSVMDVFAADGARSKMLAQLWRSVFREECSLPVRSCIGNHDVRPWSKPSGDGGVGNGGGDCGGGLAGKAWALDMLGLERRYYAFDQAGWRFLVLDSVQPSGGDYTSGIDAEQLAWLEQELKTLNGARPVVIVSHIPIFTVQTARRGRPICGSTSGTRLSKWGRSCRAIPTRAK